MLPASASAACLCEWCLPLRARSTTLSIYSPPLSVALCRPRWSAWQERVLPSLPKTGHPERRDVPAASARVVAREWVVAARLACSAELRGDHGVPVVLPACGRRVGGDVLAHRCAGQSVGAESPQPRWRGRRGFWAGRDSGREQTADRRMAGPRVR